MLDDKEFDREFRAARKTTTYALYFSGLVVIGVLSGIGFVVYKVLQHFGIM
jgi:hypothetical protein